MSTGGACGMFFITHSSQEIEISAFSVVCLGFQLNWCKQGWHDLCSKFISANKMLLQRMPQGSSQEWLNWLSVKGSAGWF